MDRNTFGSGMVAPGCGSDWPATMRLACPSDSAISACNPRKTWLAALARSFEQFTGFQVNDGVVKKLQQRFAATADDVLENMVHRLKGLPFHHPEWQELLDTLTVHETYFYRDAPQLEHVQTTVLPRIIDHAAKKRSCQLRIWSAGCSTGEEVYMLAFLVLDALMQKGQAQWTPQGEIQVHPAWDIEILGSDLSTKVLDQARQGRYRSNHRMSSFRDLPANWRIFFNFPMPSTASQAAITFAEVKPSVRRFTRFVQQNLTRTVAPDEAFDLVFCRNVLIYFKEEVKLKVQGMLHQSLRPGGALVLGPPDVLLLPQSFRRLASHLSVCYEKC